MAPTQEQIDQVIEKLVRDVETAVHALYRGDVRQQTVKARTDTHRRAAKDAIAKLLGRNASASTTKSGTMNGNGMSSEDAAALSRCVMAWLPMGAPSAATPDSRCIPAGRELIPAWGERERARQALRKLAGG